MAEQGILTEKTIAPIISIVTPIYSRPELIAPGLDSCFSQGLDDVEFEVIAVDNGAVDPKVNEILQSYTYNGKRPENLRVIHVKENRRAGSGRNAGIRAAKGDFILHKDHDDAFVPGALRKIVDEIKITPDLDLLFFDFEIRLFENFQIIQSNSYVKNSTEIMSGNDYLLTQQVPNYMWHTAYNRKYILSHDLFIKEGVLIEDMDYSLGVICYASKVRYTPIVGLCYYKFGESGGNVTSTVLDYNFKFVSGFLEMIERVNEKGENALQLGYPGGKTLTNIYHFYYNETLLRKLWQIPFREIITCLKQHPLAGNSPYKLSRLVSKHPMVYAIGAKAIAPLYRAALITYRKIKGIKY